jgi:hypothetical protein
MMVKNVSGSAHVASKWLDNAHPFGMQLTAAKTYIASGQTSMHTVAIAGEGFRTESCRRGRR